MVDPGLMGQNLFRPLPRKGRALARKRMFEVEAVHDGRKLKVVGPYTLGADDLSVLLSIMALAGFLGSTITAAGSEASRVAIVDGLETKGEVAESKHIRIRTTLYATCREAGLQANGDSYDRVASSLERMSMVAYTDLGPVSANARSHRTGGSQRLLSFSMDEATGEVVVVINARFAAVILGAHFVRVNLTESRQLGEMARLLHLRLTLTVRQGRSLTVSTDQLGDWIYGLAASSMRERVRRREEVRHGLEDLSALDGWCLSENRRRLLVTVKRESHAEKQTLSRQRNSDQFVIGVSA